MSVPASSSPSSSGKTTRIIAFLVALLLATSLWSAWLTLENWRAHRAGEEETEALTMAWFGLRAPVVAALDSRFVDADGDLVADAPGDSAQRVSPEKLCFSYVAGSGASKQIDAWREFADYLSKNLGRSVEVVSFPSVSDEVAALREGKLHLAAFNTGTVPTAVNTCGYVPVCTLGHADGSYGITMSLIVPARSAMQSLRDLKGHTIAFTDRDSNSGYKAAVVLLRDADLLPERDYNWEFSGSHRRRSTRSRPVNMRRPR